MHWELYKNGDFIASGEDGSRSKAIAVAKQFGSYPKTAPIRAAEELGYNWLWTGLE